VWENVPGVLSSNGGRDFGSFLGAMGELGYGVSYRVLDAQWVRTHGHPRAVPQRRRRVFVVGCLGDWTRAAQVLFERESVQRDSSPRRAPREGAAGNAEGGVGTDIITSHRVAPCLETTSNNYSRADGFTMVAQPTVWPANCAGTLGQSASGTGSPGYSNQEIFSQNAANLIPQPIPFTKAKRAQSVTDDETWVDGQVNPTLSLFDQGDTRATTVAVAFPINTLTLGGRPDAVNDKRMTMGVGENGDPQFTLQAAHGHAVAVGFNWQNGGGYGNANEGLGITVEGTGPLQRCNTPAVAFQQNQLGEVRCGNIAGTVNTNSNASGRNTPMAMQAMTVRRLTPRECERLQGFPDDYTLIPWRKKQAEDCPDGPRYRALGNSMAVNCMSWIGERIAALENNR
jgi:DNA (cytosine-5)-methyltransferase 1